MNKSKKLRFLDSRNTPSPLLILISMVLITAFKISTVIFPEKTGDHLGYLIVQLIVFFMPAYLYSKQASSGKLSLDLASYRINPPKVKYTFLVISGAVLLSVSAFILNVLFRWNMGYPNGFFLYNTFFTGNISEPDSFIYPLITFALAPSICEEFIFRGIIHRSYEKQGFACAAIMSSIMYTLITFDPLEIPSALFFGAFMSLILYLTDSLLSCLIINFSYKVFMLYFGTNMADYILSGSNISLFIIVLIALFLLSLCFFARECSKIFNDMAISNVPDPLGGQTFKSILSSVKSCIFTVCILLCVIIYIAFNIASMFI